MTRERMSRTAVVSIESTVPLDAVPG